MAKKLNPRAQRLARSRANRGQQLQSAANVFGADEMRAGAFTANQFLKPGSLGRVDTGIQMTTVGRGRNKTEVPMRDAQGNPVRIQENAEVLSRYKNLADQGYSAQEFQGLREQQQRGMNSALATQMAELARQQARGRVYGAAASAQQANALRADADTRANLEQDLFLKGADFKRQALGAYSGQLGQMQANELERQKINLGQTSAEKSGQLGAYFNTIGLGQTKKLTEEQLAIAREAVNKGMSY